MAKSLQSLLKKSEKKNNGCYENVSGRNTDKSNYVFGWATNRNRNRNSKAIIPGEVDEGGLKT